MRQIFSINEYDHLVPALSQVGLGEIVFFVPRGVSAGQKLRFDNVTLRTGHTFRVRNVETFDPELFNVVAMRRPSLVSPGYPTYIVARLKWTGEFEGVWSYFEERLLRPFTRDVPIVEDVSPYSYGGRLEQEPIHPSFDDSVPPGFLPPKYGAGSDRCLNRSVCHDLSDEIDASELDWDDEPFKTDVPDRLIDAINSEETEGERSLADERRRWEDAISALVLGYVSKFGEMPPTHEIERVIRGKLMINGASGRLSRLVVNGDMKIVLPAYNEIELRMTPLVRTVYILFLCHPEGIRLKEIADYREELAEIYSMVKPGASERLAEESIDSLVDPLSDSLRQKLSRSREAVRRYILDPEHVGHYLIEKMDDGRHRIGLSADLIQLPAALVG